MSTEIEDEEIVKPRTDKRTYRRIVLGNSLQVLLISDRDTEKSAACMSVGVGFHSDPDGLEGVNYLLMRVMKFHSASEKYPSEDTYSKYITEHGGYKNSTSSPEETSYYFDISNDCFEEALERFSQIFIKPLMLTEATMREIETVESAHQRNLMHDGRRRYQLERHFSMESHPYHRFGSGNWYTLDVRPKAKGLDIRHELLKFYEENYFAHIMRLVVYTKESIDKIQSLVENKFQDIRNSSHRGFHNTALPFASEHLMILVKVIPIYEGNYLYVAWPMSPSERHHYKEGPSEYLAHVIGHKGEGSVYYILKKLGWATALSAGAFTDTSEFSTFKVTICLTDAGHEQVQNIIGLLFKYIQHLNEPSHVCKWVFDELSAVYETRFHYQDQIPPIQYVKKIASNMQLYPPKYWLVGSSLPSNFNPDLVHMFLRQLSPENVRIFWESKKFEGNTDKVEPWYGTAYSVGNVTTSMIQKWMSSAPNDNLQLPAPNMFIPTNLSLKELRDKVKFPVLLRKSSYSKLWYKPDTMFSIPKAFVKIEFNCPNTRNSPEAEVLANIFIRLLQDHLNEHAYYADVAGLDYSVACTARGFEVTVFGYNDKLNNLLETVIHKIADFEVKPDRFSIIKEMITKYLRNFKFQEPNDLTFKYSSLILTDIKWPWKDKLEVLPHLGVEDLVKFTPTMLSRAFLECFVAGNMEREEAISIIVHVEDIFFKGSNPICQPILPSLHPGVVKFERGVNYLYSEEGPNPRNENSALLHHIQVHRDDFALNVKLHLFHHIAKQPAYHQLSTIEQLGYINFFGLRSNFGIHGVEFLIQSVTKSPRDIDLRVEEFLEMLENKIYEMTNNEFQSNVKALIDAKLEKHKNLRAESKFYWEEIINGTLKFDRKEAEVAMLRQLTQQEFTDFFNEYIKVGSPRKKTLSVRVYGKKHLSEYRSEKSEPLDLDTVRIDDILSFRRSQSHYGVWFKGSFSDMKL